MFLSGALRHPESYLVPENSENDEPIRPVGRLSLPTGPAGLSSDSLLLARRYLIIIILSSSGSHFWPVSPAVPDLAVSASCEAFRSFCPFACPL